MVDSEVEQGVGGRLVKETHEDTNQYSVQLAGMPGCSGWGPTPFVGNELTTAVVVLEVGVPGTGPRQCSKLESAR